MSLHDFNGPGASRDERSRRVAAVLGPTNTGKTHLAVERMLGHSSGMIGLPLRLLAREVYNKVVARVGPEQVALITGEEKIKPRNARYWIATVEAMPRDLDVSFLAVDEIQLAADLDRGHVFTDRLLYRRGREETMMIGAATMGPLIERLLPNATIVTRPRLSNLSFAGERKISRLPERSAIVAFSADEVYSIAELIRRQRGGAAVVLGALSPRTRNAQVEMYQNGEVDFIIATDAVGMGLNLNVNHVAFASDRKYDGWQHRRLTHAEFAQIAGRAGRFSNDGTFGTTGRCPAFDAELVEALETHNFEPLTTLQWRNGVLDFSTIDALRASLEADPPEYGLVRPPLGQDVLVLESLARDPHIRKIAATKADVQRLWEACQVPDYRKLSPAAHADLVQTLYGFVVRAGRVPDDWFAVQLSAFDRTDGDIDALSARIAQVRTFNYIANRPDWLRDPEHWQGVTRQVEDNLSDALHERLTHRFVDRRTSVLMRRLRENAMLEAEITNAGDVLVEGQHVGVLHGFRFTPDPSVEGEAQKTLNAAAQKALASEIEGRAQRINDAVDQAFVLAHDGALRWLGEAVGKIAPGDHILKPQARVIADEQLSGPALEMVQRRLDLWLAQHVKKLLGALAELETGEGLEGIARGIAFQTAESLGVLERSRVASDIKSLDQTARSALRKLGVRFGAHHLYVQQLLKPAPRALAAQLWALNHGGLEVVKGFDEVPHLAASGRTSIPANQEAPRGLYLAAGFRVCGERAVRVDILERLADLIRPAISYRPGITPGEPPAGAADGDAFVVTVAMTSLVGCSGEAFASILKSLGYNMERRKGAAITVPLAPSAPTQPLTPQVAQEAAVEGGEPVADETVAEAAPEAVEASESAPQAVKAAAEAPAEAAVQEVAQEAVEAEAVEVAAEATPEPEAQAEADSETPAPETVAGDSAEGEALVEEAPVEAEEVFTEVWRPHRQSRNEGRHENRRPQRGGRGGQRGQQGAQAPSGEVATGETAGAPRPEGERRNEGGNRRFDRKFGDKFGDKSRESGAPGAPAAAGQPTGQPGERPRRDDRKSFGRNKSSGDRNKPRDDRGSSRQFATTEAPKGRDRQPDPDSPFAKLLALKAQLEGKGSNGKGS